MLVTMGLLAADAWALAWVGLWLGLNAKKSWTTAFGALARIVLLPSLIFLVLFMMTRASGGSPGGGRLHWVVVWAFIGAVNSFCFGISAMRNLHTRFRSAATQTGSVEPEQASLSAQPPAETPAMEDYFSLFKG